MSHWYVIHSKPKHEPIVQENLRRQGFRTCLPLIAHQKQTTGKWATIIEPMFPGYLFVYFLPGENNFASIKYTHGVTHLVNFGMEFATISEHIVAGLINDADERGVIKLPHTHMKSHDHQRVLSGPFAGFAGIQDQMNGNERNILLMNILWQEKQHTFNPDQLELAESL